MQTNHYFDWAATSPADEDILRQAMELTLKDWGNPSSSHTIGKNARTLLEQAREHGEISRISSSPAVENTKPRAFSRAVIPKIEVLSVRNLYSA